MLLIVKDAAQNPAICASTITVEDSIDPEAKCKDYMATCSGAQVTISTSDIDDGSSDNCGAPTLSLD